MYFSKDNKNDDQQEVEKADEDKEEIVSVNDVYVDGDNYCHDLLAKIIAKGCKSDWTSFSELYAKGYRTFS